MKRSMNVTPYGDSLISARRTSDFIKSIHFFKWMFILGVGILSFTDSFAQVGISSTSITPDASSILELRSTSAGFLPPRMTTTQRDAITSPAAGLLIYNTTTNQLNYYTGSAWQLVSGGSSGTVTSTSVTTANGFAGTVSTSTTTPAITISTSVNGIAKGNGTALSAATSGIDYSAGTSGLATGILKSTTATGALSIAIASDFPTLNQNTTGSAATVTTNANLTGDVTSVGNATTLPTVNSNVGTWNSVSVNGKGLVTAGSNTTYVTAETDPVVKAINGLVKSNGTTISAATVRTDYAEPTTALATGLLKNTTTTGLHTIAVAGTDYALPNANTNGSAGSFTGNLSGDVTGTQSATSVGKINGTSLAGLSTGILKNTTTTGVPSIALASDFPTLNQNTTGNAATVTTNANLTGEVTSIGNAATVPNATVIGKVLTGFVSGAGVISATDNILQAIQKLNGNNSTNANLTGPITSVGNATSITSQTGTGTTFVMNTSPTLVTPNLGTPSAGVATNLTGTAAGLTAGNVTTNANLTGDVTSVGNATTLATVNSNVGTFNSVTVNAKGLVTAATITTTELTGKTNADVNSTYPDNSTYWSNVISANGFPVNGFLNGIRKGTFNSQRVQDQLNGSTYARGWIEGTTSWSAWAIYLDGNDFLAKGQMHIASGNNSVGVLTVGTDGQVLTADAASTNGVKWGAVTGTGNIVLATSPTLTTPVLGVANATSLGITGTAGNGFLSLATQSATPAAPGSGTVLFSNSNSKLSWRGSANTFIKTFDGAAATADRIYTLPDADGTIAVSASGNIALSATGNLSITGILPIANGGTNSSATPTNGGIVYGTGTAIQYSAAGTTGQVLTSNGVAAPSWINGGTMMLAGISNNTAVNNTTLYFPINGALAGNAADLTAGNRTLISRSGTITNLIVRISAALAAGKTGTVTLMKNGVATLLNATLSVGLLTFTDNTNAISVVAGDELSIKVTTTGNVKFSWAADFTY